MSVHGTVEFEQDTSSDDQGHGSLEQLCQVAVHERSSMHGYETRTVTNDGSPNIIMFLPGTAAPKVVDSERRVSIVKSQSNFTNHRFQSQYGNITFVNCVKAETSSPSADGTLRELSSHGESELFTAESFQATDSIILNSEKSPTFPQQYRKTRDFIPEDLKDEGYWIKRKKNNEAAKRSREKRRNNDAALESRVLLLQQFNEKLTEENKQLKKLLSQANEKVQYLQNEREIQKLTTGSQIVTAPSSALNFDHVTGKLSAGSQQSAPFLYIHQNASNRSKFATAVEQIELNTEHSVGPAIGRVHHEPSTQFNHQVSLDPSTATSILPSANSIIQQNNSRHNSSAHQIAHAPNNSIIVPLHSLSGISSVGTQGNQIASGTLVPQSKNTSVVYINTGCGVVPLNATVVQASPACKIDSSAGPGRLAGSSVEQNTISLHGQGQTCLRSASEIEGTAAALESSCTASLILQSGDSDSTVKGNTLVSLSTPIDHIIPLKKRFKDSSSCADEQSPGTIGFMDPQSVSSNEGRNLPATPVSESVPTMTLVPPPLDPGPEADSSSNAEYWKNQLISIMSEVERLKHQMGSITQQSNQHVHDRHSLAGNLSAPDTPNPPCSSSAVSTSQVPQNSATSYAPSLLATRASLSSNADPSASQSPLMSASSVNNVGSDSSRIDSPLTNNNASNSSECAAEMSR